MTNPTPRELVEPAFERQPGESDRAFGAFRAFRDLGSARSVSKAYRQQTGNEPATGQAPGHWNEWSRRFRWHERATRWDCYVDAEARAAQVQAVRDANARHILFGRGLQTKAIQALAQLNPGDLSASD